MRLSDIDPPGLAIPPLALGCYVNCYVEADLNLVSTPFRASCQFKSSGSPAAFELVFTYLHYG
jgi:hypothetical protein